MIDQQIEIPTKTATHLHQPSRTRRPFPSSCSTWTRRRSARSCATWRAGSRPRLLRDAAEPVLPLRRHGARRSRRPEAPERSDVRHMTRSISQGDGRHRRPARLGDGQKAAIPNRRRPRLLHERPLRDQRGDAFSGPGQAAASIYGTHWPPTGPTAASRRAKTKADSISPAPNDIYARRRSSQGRGGREGRNAEVRSIRHHHVLPFRAAGLPPRRGGAALERLLALYRRNLRNESVT